MKQFEYTYKVYNIHYCFSDMTNAHVHKNTSICNKRILTREMSSNSHQTHASENSKMQCESRKMYSYIEVPLVLSRLLDNIHNLCDIMVGRELE